jgi:hypothetical protein
LAVANSKMHVRLVSQLLGHSSGKPAAKTHCKHLLQENPPLCILSVMDLLRSH